MSKIKNDGLDQYGAEPFEEQQFGTAPVEGVNRSKTITAAPLTSQAEYTAIAHNASAPQ